MSKEIIKLDHIDVTFHQKKREIVAVKDVTIHINEGDIYGIVGYSGAGKSTLVRVINLLQVPSAGTITVDGDVIYQDRVTLNAAALRQKRRDIGMIFQHFNLMAQMTAAENVAFALKHSDLSKEQKAEKVAKFRRKTLNFLPKVGRFLGSLHCICIRNACEIDNFVTKTGRKRDNGENNCAEK